MRKQNEPAKPSSSLLTNRDRNSLLVYRNAPVAKTIKEDTMKDQPNLQTILRHHAVNAYMGSDANPMDTDKAIDAIYAGLLAKLPPNIDLGTRQQLGLYKDNGEQRQYDLAQNVTIELMEKALKRWCYGDTKETINE